jgi:hypothetical protein
MQGRTQYLWRSMKVKEMDRTYNTKYVRLHCRASPSSDGERRRTYTRLGPRDGLRIYRKTWIAEPKQ